MHVVIVLSLIVSTVMAADTKISHPFVCADIHKKQIMKVNDKGEVTWSYAAEGVHDIWQLKNGNILLAGPQTGVQEVTPDKKVAWSYNVKASEKIFSCQPLPNDGVLVGIGKNKRAKGPNKIVEVNRDGAVTKTIELKTKKDIRLVRKSKSGNYIVAVRGEKKVQVYDSTGQLTRDIPVPGNTYLAVELENGNILATCGDGHTIVEVDRNNKIVWQIKEKEIPGHPLRFIAGVQRLANGNTMVVNWGGHGHVGKQPQIFEVTPEKKVVWQVFDNEQFITPVHVQLLDVKGDPAQGELYR